MLHHLSKNFGHLSKV